MVHITAINAELMKLPLRELGSFPKTHATRVSDQVTHTNNAGAKLDVTTASVMDTINRYAQNN